MKPQERSDDCNNGNTIPSQLYACTIAPRPHKDRKVVYRDELDKVVQQIYCKAGGVKEHKRRYEVSKQGILHVHLLFEARMYLKYTNLKTEHYSIKTLKVDNLNGWINYMLKDSSEYDQDAVFIKHISMHKNLFSEPPGLTIDIMNGDVYKKGSAR